ncbi:hypothetical protein BS329_15675 [Amycolatopsis coloradensis]|uniref:Uncharacterized protein n=1 Tax=Amycolatopsis coloradensis TaxID=76021 RepID=A0A1R0KU93_9PSEU|nr:hypothetical protein [Amycolatopsis coloradensis]OLZ51702.1 hypothetical protein BS329_15675 [Amycolatopsis coloradensis]
MPDEDRQFTGRELPILIAAECPVDTDSAAVGQLIAEAVTAVSPPMAASVALTTETVDPPQDPALLADLDVIDPGGRHRASDPRRQLVYALTLHVNSDAASDDTDELITEAYEAIAVQLDAAHQGAVTSAVMPLDPDRYQELTSHALKTFRTRTPRN